MTRDVEGAKAFYGEMVGWRFESMPMEGGTYWVCKDGDQPVGGILDISGRASRALQGSGSPISRSTTWMRGSNRRRLRAQS
jgi:predicted enzyme related to lactoylglutathione lyase